MKTAVPSPTFSVTRSKDRAFYDHGWLKTYHSFSFAEYHDPHNMNWGTLRVFNDDYVAPASGFPTHPHRDMDIVTYVLEGELTHEDSMGNRGVVGPGGVQYMSAGTGVLHSEFNRDPQRPLHFVQMWVLPDRTGKEPAYGQLDFAAEDRHNRWLPIVDGLTVARIDDALLVHEFAPHRYGFLFVADGMVEANGEALQKGDAVRLFDVSRLGVKGHGELVLWDLPPHESFTG